MYRQLFPRLRTGSRNDRIDDASELTRPLAWSRVPWNLWNDILGIPSSAFLHRARSRPTR
jgi:hypothetical protein